MRGLAFLYINKIYEMLAIDRQQDYLDYFAANMAAPRPSIEGLYEVTQQIQAMFRQINSLLSSYLKQGNSAGSLPQKSKIQRSKAESFIRNSQIKRLKKKPSTNAENPEPKQSLSPFFLFLRDKRNAVHDLYPELTPQELLNVMGQLWNNLSEEEKRPYFSEHRQTKTNTRKLHKNE